MKLKKKIIFVKVKKNSSSNFNASKCKNISFRSNLISTQIQETSIHVERKNDNTIFCVKHLLLIL